MSWVSGWMENGVEENTDLDTNLEDVDDSVMRDIQDWGWRVMAGIGRIWKNRSFGVGI